MLVFNATIPHSSQPISYIGEIACLTLVPKHFMQTLFDSDFLKRVEYLSLLSKRVFKGQLLAQRRTKQTGGGAEFADHRPYIHGDDLRYLDWNVYARLGDVLLRRFQEEEDLHVYILLDCSRSMEATNKVGDTLTKFDFARQLAACLAYIALADLDRISIVAYDSAVRATMPLLRGKDHVLGVLRFLEGLKTSGEKTDLVSVVDNFTRTAPRSGLVLVISDLFDQQGFGAGVDRLRHRRFEPHLVQVHTRSEAKPTLLGDVELADIESGVTRKVTITQSKLKQYEELFAKFIANIERYCRTYGLSHTRATTDVPFDAVLMKMMRVAGSLG